MQAPGDDGLTPKHFPSVNGVALRDAQPTVLVFIHPLCPCTPATLAQLKLIADSADVSVIQSGPAVDIQDEDVGRSAQKVSRFERVIDDRSGELARSFGAMTSGHIVAYAPDGSLLFRGGITPGRGMTGPSQGLAELAKALETSMPSAVDPDVFGCSIFGSSCCAEARGTPVSLSCCGDGGSS